jgi:hypothetical protein
MGSPNQNVPLATLVSLGLTEWRWITLTRGFSNVATTFTLRPLTLVGRLQFLGRIFDQDLQMPNEFPNVVCVVMAFDELNTLLDWREAASKRYD